MTFTTATRADGAVSGRHIGFLGIVFAEAKMAYNAPARSVQIGAYVPTVGSSENPTARAWLENDFRAPGTGNTRAQITGTVKWLGRLAGNGALGSGSGITIEAKVFDGNTVVATNSIYKEERRDSYLSVGGIKLEDSESFAFSADLVGGKLYSLRIEATCKAFSGLVGSVAHCLFIPNDFYPEKGYVQWTALAVRF